jgi:hypothetical protein
MSIKDFQLERFTDSNHSHFEIPEKSGNYIVCITNLCDLPSLGCDIKYSLFRTYRVLYTGITSKSLRNRYYKQHFKGDNAGRSTLRLSLGVLLGYQKTPRDKNVINNKYKFNSFDEIELSAWMKNNLIFYYLVNDDINNIEDLLIKELNPPLNLSKNKSPLNSDFRRKLSSLRNSKILDEQKNFQPAVINPSENSPVKNTVKKSQKNKEDNDSPTIPFKSILKYIAFAYMFYRLICFITS